MIDISAISVRRLSFTYEGSFDPVFEDVSVELSTDWRLGLVGRNGRGKSTLLKLLAGQLDAHGCIRADVPFDMFPYAVEDESAFALDVMRTIAPDALDWQIAREISLLNVAEDVLWQSFDTLSQGERTKLMLAALFLKGTGFPLIDEPTNHLDAPARRLLGQYLAKKKGFILVSHDRALLNTCIDHVMAINRSTIEVRKGDFSSWWADRQARDASEAEQNERLKKDIRRLQESARQRENWSEAVEKTKKGAIDSGYVGHKAAKMMRSAQNLQHRQQAMIEEKKSLLRDAEKSDALKLPALRYFHPRLAQVRDLSVRYGDREIFGDLSFDILTGERIALCGANGCGKTSVLRLLCGESVPHNGIASVGSGVILSAVRQSAEHLSGSLEAYAQAQGLDYTRFLTLLRKLDFSRAQFEKDMEHFSGGQKKKVLLAASLCTPAHLYLWDEPLNYIDVLSRIQIEELILQSAPTLLFVEHDRAFCDRIATRKIAIGKA